MISSVVTQMELDLWPEMSRIYFNQKALFVAMGVKTGMRCWSTTSGKSCGPHSERRSRVPQLRGPCIVVDFGKRSRFEVAPRAGDISAEHRDARHRHSVEALFDRAARLPRVLIANQKIRGTVMVPTQTTSHASRPVLWRDRYVRCMLSRIKKELG